MFPVFTQLEGSDLKKAFIRIFKYNIILLFPLSFGLIFLSEPIIRLVYGVEFLPAVLPMSILSLLVISSTSDFLRMVFQTKEKPEYPAMIVIISMVLNIILNYFLIIRFGIIGAAMATVISRFFNFVSLGFLSGRILNISPDASSIYKPLIASTTMLLLLYFIPKPKTLLIGLIEFIFTGIIYLVVLFSIKGIDKNDLEYVGRVFGLENNRVYQSIIGKLF